MVQSVGFEKTNKKMVSIKKKSKSQSWNIPIYFPEYNYFLLKYMIQHLVLCFSFNLVDVKTDFKLYYLNLKIIRDINIFHLTSFHFIQYLYAYR